MEHGCVPYGNAKARANAFRIEWDAYAPPRPSAIQKIDPAMLPNLPTAPDNFKNALQIDATFWADNFDTLNNRFQTWLGQ